GGSQLERKRQLFQPRAELGDVLVRLEARLGRAGTDEEELRAILGLELRNRVRLLAGEAQELAAGDEQLEVRTRGRELGQLVCRLDEMLEVVEQQQQPLVGHVLGQSVPRSDSLPGLLEHEPPVT